MTTVTTMQGIFFELGIWDSILAKSYLFKYSFCYLAKVNNNNKLKSEIKKKENKKGKAEKGSYSENYDNSSTTSMIAHTIQVVYHSH